MPRWAYVPGETDEASADYDTLAEVTEAGKGLLVVASREGRRAADAGELEVLAG